MYWSETHKHWKVEDLSNPSIYAISNGSSTDSYPMGTNVWNIYNNESVSATELSLTACRRRQFNCQDGTW